MIIEKLVVIRGRNKFMILRKIKYIPFIKIIKEKYLRAQSAMR